jgi:hypothetical protein
MRNRIVFAALAAFLVSGCSEEGSLLPNSDVVPDGPGFAIVDAGNGGEVGGFWFLPPLAQQVTTEGVLDNELDPAMWVCQLEPAQVFLDGEVETFVDTGTPKLDEYDQPVFEYPDDPNDWGFLGCTGAGEDGVTGATKFTDFPEGSAELSPDAHYQFSWDTSDEEIVAEGEPGNLIGMDSDEFYRIHVSVRDVVLGSFDVNPQNPSGQTPGEDVDGLYAFRLGENLPVKVFITPQVRCATAQEYVVQCTAEGVIDQTGGTVTLEENEDSTRWVKISTHLQEGSFFDMDGNPLASVIVQLERISPASPPRSTRHSSTIVCGSPRSLRSNWLRTGRR